MMVDVVAIRAADFLDSLGIVTHLEYTDGGYANTSNVLADLNYLNIHNLRTGAPNPSGGAPYQNYLVSLDAAASAGNRFDFGTTPAVPLATSLEQIDAVAKAHPGSVIAVEGPNEIDNSPVTYKGLSGNSAAVAYQADLYAAVKQDPNLSGVPVYYFTGGSPAGSLSGLADDANGHPYPYQGQQPAPRIAQEFASHFSISGAYPKVSTETGYYDQPTNPSGSGVDDATQASSTLNLVLDSYQEGVSRTYLYQLLSAYPDPNGTDSDTEYGLFRQDNSPKPVATALHNLTTILSDAGRNAASFSPGQLNYSLSGLPANAHSMLLEASSGRFDLAIWAEPQNWDEAQHKPIPVPASNVTVSLGATYGTVSVFDPTKGTNPIQTLSNVSGVQVGISDHPVIVQVGAAASTSSPTVQPPPAGPVPAPQGDGQIHFLVSEDAFAGDATFHVELNGATVGGENTVTTAHASGGWQDIAVAIRQLTPTDIVTAVFDNDRYGGSPSLDRNLYVEQATYQGQILLPGNSAHPVGLLRTGDAAHFTVS